MGITTEQAIESMKVQDALEIVYRMARKNYNPTDEQQTALLVIGAYLKGL